MTYAVQRGGVAGALAGSATAAAVFAAHSASPWFRRSFGISGRAGFVTIAGLGFFYLYAEHALHDCQRKLHRVREVQQKRDAGILTQAELTVALEQYYRIKNPDRTEHAGTIAAEYIGRQDELSRKLSKMYGTPLAAARK
jgi:hypothetical protein